MKHWGFGRKGAIEITIAVALATAAFAIPFLVAAFGPETLWFMTLTGPPALTALLLSIFLFLLYAVGFYRYAHDKGYSAALSIVLVVAALPGLVALLLLPDLTHPLTDVVSDRNRTFAH